MIKKLKYILSFAALFAALPIMAGGPLANCSSGVPFRWGNGGAGIAYSTDLGNLGPVNQAAAVQLVADAFQAWEDVASSTASYVNAGPILDGGVPVDVDITNFGPFLNATAPDGQSAIVFDDDGQIFDLLFGPGSGVLGFAGPEWADTAACTITEGLSFLNGPSFVDPVAALDVMVHEFGHFSNLAHTDTNGEIYIGDFSGPDANVFGPIPNPINTNVVETMYPFYFGPGIGSASPELDDIAILSTLYPEPNFLSTTGTISGTVYAANGSTRLSGANIIVRNLADPFFDANSAISGDFTDGVDGSVDPVVGTFTINGLTPGADYALFVDGILAGGFSTTPLQPLPGVEEFYNGANESQDPVTDNPLDLTPITVTAGSPVTGIDIIFNEIAPGPIPIGDDDFVELSLPFEFIYCGNTYSSVFVNSNGHLTFEAPDTAFAESKAAFLTGVPRIAGLWRDLNPTAGGVVSFDRTDTTFSVTWTDVPEFPADGANNFTITLKKHGYQVDVDYGAMTATNGLSGISCGGALTSGFESESNLSAFSWLPVFSFDAGAVFELFQSDDFDLDGDDLGYLQPAFGFFDLFEPNNTLASARHVSNNFNTSNTLFRYSEIDPDGGDVDFYRFSVDADDILAVEVVTGQIDTLIGIFDADTGDLLLVDDDGGNGTLSRALLQVNEDLNLAVAVTTFPDVGFTGAGGDGGRYVLSIKTYQGDVIPVGDDTTSELTLPFNFKFQGDNYSSVFLNSNGNFTFGQGDTSFLESVPAFLSGPPRIAPLWDDFNPLDGLVVLEEKNRSVEVHFVSVPKFFSSAANYFSLKLRKNNRFEIDYGAVTEGDGIVGITAGKGATDPGPTDLTWKLLFGVNKNSTTYEEFGFGASCFDLAFLGLYFR